MCVFMSMVSMSMAVSMSMTMTMTAVRLPMSVIVTVVTGVGRVRMNRMNRMVGSMRLVMIIRTVGVGGCVMHAIGPGTYSAIWLCAVSAVGTCSVAHCAVAVTAVATVALSSGSQIERTGIRQYALLAGPRAWVVRVGMSRTRLSPVGLHRDRRMDRGLALMKREMEVMIEGEEDGIEGEVSSVKRERRILKAEDGK